MLSGNRPEEAKTESRELAQAARGPVGDGGGDRAVACGVTGAGGHRGRGPAGCEKDHTAQWPRVGEGLQAKGGFVGDPHGEPGLDTLAAGQAGGAETMAGT